MFFGDFYLTTKFAKGSANRSQKERFTWNIAIPAQKNRPINSWKIFTHFIIHFAKHGIWEIHSIIFQFAMALR